MKPQPEKSNLKTIWIAAHHDFCICGPMKSGPAPSGLLQITCVGDVVAPAFFASHHGLPIPEREELRDLTRDKPHTSVAQAIIPKGTVLWVSQALIRMMA